MRSILLNHAARYPLWQMEDLYKLLHQACLGSEHAIKSTSGARIRLRLELEGDLTGPSEPLVDPISPDGSVVRIHLRPFEAHGLDPEALLNAFLKAPAVAPGAPARLSDALGEAIALSEEGLLPFGVDRILAFGATMRGAGFPPVHHSSPYREAYRPAYRVVLVESMAPEILAAASLPPPENPAGLTRFEAAGARPHPRVDRFLAQVSAWAQGDERITAVVLVGSYARGTASPDSDVDLVLITRDPATFLDDVGWTESFGAVQSRRRENWSAVTSLRVTYMDGLEAEFGLTHLAWGMDPQDQGTAAVIRGGFRVLFDRGLDLAARLKALAAGGNSAPPRA